MRTALALLVLLAVIGSPRASHAQFRDQSRIRRTSRGVLERSEFRHLRGRLKEVDPRSLRGDGVGNRRDRRALGEGDGGEKGGNGGNGAERNGGNNGRDARDVRDQGGMGRGDRRITRTRTGRSDGGGGGSSSSFGSSGGSAGGGIGQVFAVLAWLLVAAICGLILYFVVRGLMERTGDRALDNDADGDDEPRVGEEEAFAAPGDRPADAYVARARQLAGAGRFREAIAQLLLGAMSFVEHRELLRFRRGLTFRNYAAALSGLQAAQRAFRAIVRTYEPIEYGRREATRAHFEAAVASYEEGFVV